MTEAGNTLSRNPNVCASCSSMADGIEESNVPDRLDPPSVISEATEPIGEHAAVDSAEILVTSHAWTEA